LVFERIAALPRLRTLALLDDSPPAKEEEVPELQRLLAAMPLTNLRCFTSNDWLQFVHLLPSLRTLRLFHVDSESEGELCAASVRSIAQAPQLEILHLDGDDHACRVARRLCKL
jgi:hypothetical protein